jgi:hypothetical protein
VKGEPEPGSTSGEQEEARWTGSLFGASEGLRGAISGAIRNVLNTDEGLRKMVRDALPSEILGHVTRSIDAGKDEIVKGVGNQTRKFLENLDLGQEIQKVLTSVSLEFRTELRFIPNDQAVRPEGRVTVKVKQGDTDLESKSVPLPAGIIRDAIVGSLMAVGSAFQRGDDPKAADARDSEPVPNEAKDAPTEGNEQADCET